MSSLQLAFFFLYLNICIVRKLKSLTFLPNTFKYNVSWFFSRHLLSGVELNFTLHMWLFSLNYPEIIPMTPHMSLLDSPNYVCLIFQIEKGFSIHGIFSWFHYFMNFTSRKGNSPLGMTSEPLPIAFSVC